MRRIVLTAVLLTFFCNSAAFANSFWDRFKDPKDGKFDLSGWSDEHGPSIGGFLLVPNIISEPAIGGLGLALGLAYLREKGPSKEIDQTEGAKEEGKQRPPSVSGVGGFYSLNNSWFIGGGHDDNWLDDSLRYKGGLGYGSLNLDFYGIELDGRPSKRSIPINIGGFVLFQDLKYRLLDSDFFLGGQYTFLSTDTTIDISGIFPSIPPAQRDSNDGGLGPTLQYDTRDNTFTPTRGSMANVSALFHGPAVGGDFTYQIYKAAGFTWFPVHSKVTLALRLEGSVASGDAPFYALPYISLRGIPALRYQNDVAIMGEIEARWQVSSRWSILGFTGSGRVADTVGDLGNAYGQHTIGTGFRYLIATKFGLHAGLDIARGPEKTYAYITIGSAW